LASLDTPIQALGYAVVLSVWSTTLLALCAWAFSRTHRGASPSARHWAAVAALVGGVVCGAIFWWLLAYPDRFVALPVPSSGDGAFQSVRPEGAYRSLPLDGSLGTIRAATPVWAGWVAVAWLAAVTLLLARFALAAASSWWIRRRATPLDSGVVADAARRMAQRLSYPRPVPVVESTQIEYPAATGWRRPSLIVPCGLDITLSREHLEPVLAHELEHLRAGDQRIAAIQALVEAFFFYSPAARWLSGLAREAREQRCDDIAVRMCGDPKAYATALSVLATRASGSWLSAVMGAQAPSLANRIKRILKGDTMTPMSRTQALALAVGVVATIGSGAVVLAISVEGMNRVGTVPIHLSQGQADTAVAVPTGFLRAQHGAPLRLTAVSGDGDYCFTRVSVRNVSEKAVVSASFAAVVEYPDRSHPSIVVTTDDIPAVVEPGASTDAHLAFLRIRDVLEWKAARGVRAQAVLGLVKVVFADGDEWAITPPSNATSHEEFFLLPVAQVSRSLVASPRQPRQAGALCRDDLGLEYSPGAVVRIQGEAGMVVCRDGAWDEQKPDDSGLAGTREPEALRLELEIIKEGTVVAHPQIAGTVGRPMSITLQPDIALTFVPTRLNPDEVRVDFDTTVGAVAGRTAVVLRNHEAARATIPGAPAALDVRVSLVR